MNFIPYIVYGSMQKEKLYLPNEKVEEDLTSSQANFNK